MYKKVTINIKGNVSNDDINEAIEAFENKICENDVEEVNSVIEDEFYKDDKKKKYGVFTEIGLTKDYAKCLIGYAKDFSLTDGENWHNSRYFMKYHEYDTLQGAITNSGIYLPVIEFSKELLQKERAVIDNIKNILLKDDNYLKRFGRSSLGNEFAKHYNWIWSFIGTIDLSKGEVDITDPCYDKDVWCRLKAKVKPGLYEAICIITEDKDPYTNSFYKRVAKHMLQKRDIDEVLKLSEKEYIGDIGVDAGLAGFFPNKPDYPDEKWLDLCNKVFNDNIVTVFYEDGVVTSSGDGDGCYPVYAKRDQNGEIVYLEIDFFPDEEEEQLL